MPIYHETHSHCKEFSPDSKRTIHELFEEGRKLQLPSICLTDHYDKDNSFAGIVTPGLSNFREDPAADEMALNPFNYVAELCGLKQKYNRTQGYPDLLIGIEMGYQDYLAEVFTTLARELPFDEIIMSIHTMNLKDIYFWPEFFDCGKKQAYEEWLLKTLELVDSATEFDILGHFDYVIRYAPYPDVSLKYNDYPDIFDSIFKSLIRREAALEINTRYIYKAPSEEVKQQAIIDQRIIKRYLDLGGKLITVSTDAHNSDDLGQGIDFAKKNLAACGVTRLCYFKQRRAYYYDM